MWCLKICVVLFIVLQNQVGNSFDEFIQGATSYSSRKETLSAMLLERVSEKCNATLRALDNDERLRCKLIIRRYKLLFTVYNVER